MQFVTNWYFGRDCYTKSQSVSGWLSRIPLSLIDHVINRSHRIAGHDDDAYRSVTISVASLKDVIDSLKMGFIMAAEKFSA